MKFNNTEVFNFEGALRGMRNPMNSWDKSDSKDCIYIGNLDCDSCILLENCNMVNFGRGGYIIGTNDLKLAQNLIKAGTEHCKFMRQIIVSVDITAPLYWWKEFDTYKVGTTSNSTSTMHFAHKRDFNLSDFEIDEALLINETSKLQNDVDIVVKKEEWKDIDGYEGLYKISNSGKILKLPYTILDRETKTRKYKGGITPTPINSSGYKKCILRKEGVAKNYYLHRLMAISFIPNPNDYPIVNHKDGNKLNCNLSNLEWCTHSDNDKHSSNMGLKRVSTYNKIKVGESTRRFSDEDVCKIFDMFEGGMTKQEISEVFECYSSTICNIINGKTYKSLDIDDLTAIKLVIDELNYYRRMYVSTNDKECWRKMIQLIPSSYLQTRTVTMNYENVINMYRHRVNHKLNEWSKSFIKWVESLPYAKELIILDAN